MKSFKLGDHTIPALGFGTWQIPDKVCAQSVETALEVGYRHIDCAPIYGNQVLVAEGIAGSGVKREDIFITSKLWRNSMKKLDAIAACEKTLEELNVDYLDLYLMHWPDRRLPMEDPLDAFIALKDKGLIREYGVSNCTVHHMNDIWERGYRPTSLQVEFHPSLNQEELRAWCEAHDVRLTAYSPIAQGHDLQLPVVVELAEKYQVSASQVILNWLMAKEIVAIPKASSREHIQDNFEALSFELSGEDVERLNGLDEGKRLINPPWGEFGY